MRNNIPAEFSLLAGLCQHPDVFFNISRHLSLDDFTCKEHKTFFTVLQRLLLDQTNNLSVTKAALLAEASAIGLKDFYKECRDGELIEACLEHQSTPADVGRAFLQVKRESIKNHYHGMFKKLDKYLDETTDEAVDIISRVDTSLLDLSNKIQGAIDDEIIALPSRALEVIDDLANHPGELGADLGFPVWQRAIGGVRNGTVTFVAASAKCGKSQFGLRAALELSRYIPVLYCDSELNETAQGVRAFGMHGEINYSILETGYWKCDPNKIVRDGYDRTFATQCGLAQQVIEDPDVRAEFEAKKLFYKKMTGMTAREMIPYLRRWVMQNVGISHDARQPRCLIVWDYIKLMRVDEVKSMGVGAHDILGDACSALHDFAEEYNLPILGFGQTNRSTDRDFSMIAGAKKLVELADSISLLEEKDADDLVNYPNGTHMLHVLGSRYGGKIRSHIDLEVDLSVGKFKELGIAQRAQAAQPSQPTPSQSQSNTTP